MSLVGTRPILPDELEQYELHHRASNPDRYRFPRRNRLISSWSDKLFVIQAEKGSGALITAEYSRKYGREVEME